MKGALAPAEGIIIDHKSIPGHVKDDLAATILGGVRAFLAQPDGRAALDAQIAAAEATSKAVI